MANRDAPEEVTVDRRPTSTEAETTPPPQGPAVAGPTDGTESLDLPVTATPSTGLRPGDTVSLTGEGFNPGQVVGVVQCTMAVTESAAGAAACDMAVLGTGSTPDAEGRATGSIEVRRVIQVGNEKVDCSAEGVRCGVAMGQIDDYDVSGAAEITFVDDLSPLVKPTLTVSPAQGLQHGDTVTVTIEDLTGPVEMLQLCAGRGQGIGAITAIPPGALAGGDEDVSGPRCWYGLEGARAGALQPDADGRVEVDVRLWRAFSPDGSAVIDCVEVQCSVFVYSTGDLDPEPVAVSFDPDGPMPPRPELQVEPTTGVRPGDTVTLTVSGLAPGTEVVVNACGDMSGTGDVREACGPAISLTQGTIGPDGTWTGTAQLPSPDSYGVDCTEEWTCALTVASGLVDAGDGSTTIAFLPAEPVPLRFAANS
jgi:hypothetical protein